MNLIQLQIYASPRVFGLALCFLGKNLYFGFFRFLKDYLKYFVMQVSHSDFLKKPYNKVRFLSQNVYLYRQNKKVSYAQFKKDILTF